MLFFEVNELRSKPGFDVVAQHSLFESFVANLAAKHLPKTCQREKTQGSLNQMFGMFDWRLFWRRAVNGSVFLDKRTKPCTKMSYWENISQSPGSNVVSETELATG